MRLYERLLADPIIRRRVATDTATRRMMRELVDSLPTEHREHMQQLIPRAEPARPAPVARSRGQRRSPTPARPRAKKPAPKPADPHAGHKPPAKTPDPHAGHKP